MQLFPLGESPADDSLLVRLLLALQSAQDLVSVTDIGIQRDLDIMIRICLAALFQDLTVFLLPVFHIEVYDQVKPDL